MVTPIKVLIFNDLHKYFNTYFADYQQVNHKLNELLIEQTRNYLKATKLQLGLIVNFGVPSLKYKRVLNS